MEHPGQQGTPTGVGQGCVRLDDVVTPTYFGFGADAFRCVGVRTGIVRTGIVNAKISERGA
jgi:hypothetical protein